MTASNVLAQGNTIAQNSAVADIAGRAHQAVDDVKGRTSPVIERASAAAHRTIDRVAESAEPAVDWAAESSRTIVNRTTEFADACSAQVRARPLVTVVGALALGYLAGRILR